MRCLFGGGNSYLFGRGSLFFAVDFIKFIEQLTDRDQVLFAKHSQEPVVIDYHDKGA